MSDDIRIEEEVLIDKPGVHLVCSARDFLAHRTVLHSDPIPADLLSPGKSLVAGDVRTRLLNLIRVLMKEHQSKRVILDREALANFLRDIASLIVSLCNEQQTIKTEVAVKRFQVSWVVSIEDIMRYPSPESYVQMMTDKLIYTHLVTAIAKHCRMIQQAEADSHRTRYILRVLIGVEDNT